MASAGATLLPLLVGEEMVAFLTGHQDPARPDGQRMAAPSARSPKPPPPLLREKSQDAGLSTLPQLPVARETVATAADSFQPTIPLTGGLAAAPRRDGPSRWPPLVDAVAVAVAGRPCLLAPTARATDAASGRTPPPSPPEVWDLAAVPGYPLHFPLSVEGVKAPAADGYPALLSSGAGEGDRLPL